MLVNYVENNVLRRVTCLSPLSLPVLSATLNLPLSFCFPRVANWTVLGEPIVATSLKLLLSARDTGAAGHVLALARGLSDAGFDTYLVLQEPALSLAHGSGLNREDARLWIDEHAPLGDRSNKNVARRLRAIAPNAVICGLSNFHSNGIDEALMLGSRNQGVRCFAVQDFWGDVKFVGGRGADDYLVLDDLAARITRAATNANCHAIGSLKHARFAGFDYLRERAAFRRTLGLDSDDRVVCLFGQALQLLPGYAMVLSDIAHVLKKSCKVRLIYKPHPLEDALAISATVKLFSEAGQPPVHVFTGPIETVLAGSDIALSCFSTIGLDAAYMVRAVGHGPVVVYADYPSDITAYWRNESGLTILPPVHDGYALLAKDQLSLEAKLNDGFVPGIRSRLFKQIQLILPAPNLAVTRAVDYIESRFFTSHRSSRQRKNSS